MTSIDALKSISIESHSTMKQNRSHRAWESIKKFLILEFLSSSDEWQEG